jgi:hypothetical protein
MSPTCLVASANPRLSAATISHCRRRVSRKRSSASRTRETWKVKARSTYGVAPSQMIVGTVAKSATASHGDAGAA